MNNHKFVIGPPKFETSRDKVDKNITRQKNEQLKRLEGRGFDSKSIGSIQKAYPFWFRMNIELLIEVYSNFSKGRSLDSMQITEIKRNDENEITLFKKKYPIIASSITTMNKIILRKKASPINIITQTMINKAVNYINNRVKINSKAFSPTPRYYALTRYYNGFQSSSL